MNEDKKVEVPKYSPDIDEFSFEGASYFFGLIASIVVAPIRLVMRVMHMIALLPAKLMVVYLRYLIGVSVAMVVVGVVSFIFDGKWIILASQAIVLVASLFLSTTLKYDAEDESSVRQLDIDEEEVEAICNGIYEELDNYFGKEE